MIVPPEDRYAALRRLGELGREIERHCGPDPYPRPTGPAPNLEELRARGEELKRVASRHGASGLRILGSVARGDAGPSSDLDVLVDLDDRRGLLEQAALQNELEDLLGCPVHVMTTGDLSQARAETRERIGQEATRL